MRDRVDIDDFRLGNLDKSGRQNVKNLIETQINGIGLRCSFC